MDLGYHIRPYRSGDENDIVPLFEECFGLPITEAHWRWKLKQLPSEAENVWVGMDEERTIFHYGGIPVRMALPSGPVRAMISVDGMTAPSHRRRGVLTHGAKAVYDHWRDRGVAFTLGLPNQQWGSRTEALGWQPLFDFRWLVRPLRLGRSMSRRLNVPALSRLRAGDGLMQRYFDRALSISDNVSVTHIERAGKAFDDIWRRLAPEVTVSIVRGQAWVGWRYFAPPDIEYRVLLAEVSNEARGYIAYRVRETPKGKLGYVAELACPHRDRAVCAALIRHCLDDMYAADVDAVFALAIPGGRRYRTYRGAGFVLPRGQFSVQIIPFDLSLPMDVLRDPDNWMLEAGDFDVV